MKVATMIIKKNIYIYLSFDSRQIFPELFRFHMSRCLLWSALTQADLTTSHIETPEPNMGGSDGGDSRQKKKIFLIKISV